MHTSRKKESTPMTEIKPPEALLSLIQNHKEFILAGHREPDGDCIGSMLALDSWLRRHGKITTLVSAGPFKRPEIQHFEPLFVRTAPETAKHKNCILLILDCSNLERLGDAAEGLSELTTALIDHHTTNDSSSPADFVCTDAPATTRLVQAIIEATGEAPTVEEAEFLLFGLCTDTGFFRHLDVNGADSMCAASRLLQCGASPKKTYHWMYGGKTINSRILLARILNRLTPCYAGALMVTWETMADTQQFGLEGRDSDSLYQLIQAIEGVEAIVIVRQETETNCTVGFRSRDWVDVSKIASRFGGGGHRQASGLSIAGTIRTVLPCLVEAFAEYFPDKPAWDAHSKPEFLDS